MVGTSGSISKRAGAAIASGVSVPAFHLLHADHRSEEHGVDMARNEIVQRRRAAAEGNVQHVDAGLGGKQLAGQMARTAGADRSVRDRAGLLPRQLHQVLDRADGDLRICREHHGRAADKADRREILQAVVGNVLEHARVHGVVVIDHHQRVAIGLGARDRGGGKGATGAGSALDDELLTQQRRQLVADDARDRIEQAADRKRHEDLDRAAGVGSLLRRRRARSRAS
jgi:hypothetical protein